MKKIITLMVIICMSVAVLAACGGSGKDSAASTSTDSAASTEAGSEASSAEDSGDAYRVIVTDESGKAVEGVMVQFCSDALCQMGETDADGIAVFADQEEGAYTVHVYSVPEGYAEDETEYPAPETYGDVNITLKAAQ